MNNFRVFSGYVWYAYPTSFKDALMFKSYSKHLPGEHFPIKLFDGAESFGNYNENGILIVTSLPLKPAADVGWEADGWDVVPCQVPEGFGGMFGKEFIRHITTNVEDPERFFSVFVGLTTNPKI